MTFLLFLPYLSRLDGGHQLVVNALIVLCDRPNACANSKSNDRELVPMKSNPRE